ncbi:Nucleolar protein of 40 kDa [Podila clonocystis]|nr:Nucleolar protein of 40 kDa [Podila clonocystis]
MFNQVQTSPWIHSWQHSRSSRHQEEEDQEGMDMDMGALVNLEVMVPEMNILGQCLISTPSIVAKWSVLKVQRMTLPVYYGAFVQIPGFHKHGLVHKSQASRHFTEKISDVVEVGDSVWVKVTSLQDDKISLSMKHVQQGTGEDLDPNLVQQTGEEDKRRTHAGFVDKAPIAIEQGGVLLKTVCKKCGAAGHLATECFSGGEKFELLGDEDDDVEVPS